ALDARIGGVDAIDVRVDFTADIGRLGPVVLHHRGESHGGGVGAAASERGDVVVLVDPLKAGDNDDVAVVERLPHALRRDVLDAGLGVEAVGDDADLGAGEADRFFAQALDR